MISQPSEGVSRRIDAKAFQGAHSRPCLTIFSPSTDGRKTPKIPSGFRLDASLTLPHDKAAPGRTNPHERAVPLTRTPFSTPPGRGSTPMKDVSADRSATPAPQLLATLRQPGLSKAEQVSLQCAILKRDPQLFDDVKAATAAGRAGTKNNFATAPNPARRALGCGATR